MLHPRRKKKRQLTAWHLTADGSKRTYLLPVLHAIHDRVGWISPGALNYASRVLDVPPAEAFGVADFYALFSTQAQPPVVAHICDDIACKIQGADQLSAEWERAHGPEASSVEGNTTWRRTPCLGLCERAPAALVHGAGVESFEQALAPTKTADIESAMQGVQIQQASLRTSVPQMGQPGLKLLRRIGSINPESLDEYLASGGFMALHRARADGVGRGNSRSDRIEASGAWRCSFSLRAKVEFDSQRSIAAISHLQRG